MDVSENRGTPKSSILIGVSIINHPFWDTPILGSTQIDYITSPVLLCSSFMPQQLRAHEKRLSKEGNPPTPSCVFFCWRK